MADMRCIRKLPEFHSSCQNLSLSATPHKSSHTHTHNCPNQLSGCFLRSKYSRKRGWVWESRAAKDVLRSIVFFCGQGVGRVDIRSSGETVWGCLFGCFIDLSIGMGGKERG